MALLLGLTVSACSGGDPGVAQRNQVFYETEMFGAALQNEFETPYPPLDKKAATETPEYTGVTVLHGKVHLSRPTSWLIRSASNQGGRRYIQYVSPNEYMVSLYERAELPNAPWHDVIGRYEKDLKESRAEIVAAAVPMATWNGQGRAYLVRRRVPGAKGPFLGVSREYLVRADNRVILVQIVHPSSGVAPVVPELSRVIETLELL